MTLNIKHKRAGHRWLVAIVGVALLTAMFGVAAVFAVHDETFQLDGDVIASTTTNYGGHTQTVDWDSLFNAAGATKSPLPTGYEAAKLTKDFNNTGTTFLTNDTSTFATGSKDTLGINGWQCNFDNNVNSKIDVMNAYAAAYTAADGDEIMYFGLERNTNTGDANVAFWFLQDEVACSSTGGAVDFVGEHHDGDLLIVSAFSNGGTVSTIDVYRWSGDDATGFLDPNPQAHGVDCRSATLPVQDDACAAANSGNISTPWLTSNFKDKVGHTLRTAEFFEGGVNLTATGLGGKCFNTFIGDTRSSTSLTATLFDYAAGTIGECQSHTTTTPKKGDGTTNITSEPIPATGTLAVKDSAAITVDGADSFDADVTFFLCGPLDLSSTGSCTSGGVQIGTAKPVTSTPSTVVSDTAQLTSAGRYCWRAEFSGDDAVGVPPSKDDSTGECFLVTPLQPALTTQATTGPVPFGNSITDTVSLTGTANQEGTDGVGPGGTINATRGGGAGGTIHVDVYGPDSCSTIAHSADLNVSGDGNYGGAGSDLEFTPAAPGVYVFVASYSGDSPNTLGITAIACADQPSNEKVTVEQIGTDIKTKQSWFPNDTATVSAEAGNLAAGGSVLFELFTTADCSGSSVYSETVSVPGGNTSAEVGTDNSTYEITTDYTDAADSLVGRHSWKITYTPAAADTSHTGSQSTCDSEHFNITYTNDNGPGTDLP
jgi:hypothetical protein